MAQPGNTYIDGSHIFSLYNWNWEDATVFEGLIDTNGDRRLSYYAFRMGIRALQAGKPVLLTASSDDRVMAIATKNDDGTTPLLLVNSAEETVLIHLDLHNIRTHGQASIQEFSDAIHDEKIIDYSFHDGQVSVTMPSQAAWLLTFRGEE